jgi:methanogenic corrinoid protein MtbC1
MNPDARFVAQILESSATGYAGLTVSLLLERHPEITTRYAPDGFTAWKDQIRLWLLDLSAAAAAGEPQLFEARMLWVRESFVARQASPEDLVAALVALRDILQERLPGDSAGTVVPTVDRAIEAITDPQAEQAGDLDPEKPGRRALSYLETILEGKPRDAIEQVLRMVDGGTPVKNVYIEVLLPAQKEAGRMWHAGDLRIAEEHVITSTTQRAMALLCERGQATEQKNRTALLSCVAGDIHDIGIRALTDFFEMAGWRAVNLGPDVPAVEIARAVQIFNADVVLLSATLDPHLKGLQDTIARVRSLEQRDVKVIVGGPALEGVPDLWRKLGADGYSARLEDAETLASQLIES